MYRFLSGIMIYGLCFCAPPIPFLLMGRLFAAMLNGLFWFFSLQLLSFGDQGSALLLYLTVAFCTVSSVRAKRIMKREDAGQTSSLFRDALKSERGHGVQGEIDGEHADDRATRVIKQWLDN